MSSRVLLKDMSCLGFSLDWNETIFYCDSGKYNKVVGGYTGFTMSVRRSVDKSYVVR
jgi:hypothetical protein